MIEKCSNRLMREVGMINILSNNLPSHSQTHLSESCPPKVTNMVATQSLHFQH
jgi:hypothetical protein